MTDDVKLPLHKHSIYTHCWVCNSWGINLPNMDDCGNCGSSETTVYYPLEEALRLFEMNEGSKNWATYLGSKVSPRQQEHIEAIYERLKKFESAFLAFKNRLEIEHNLVPDARTIESPVQVMMAFDIDFREAMEEK